jgi:hypothetical protein
MLLVTGKTQHREELRGALEDMAKKLATGWAAAQHEVETRRRSN